MKLQRLLSLIRQAVDQYEMIEEGDHIAIGISGGKDSLTMLYALHGLRRFYEKHFEIEAITVDLGFPNFDLSPIQALCNELGVRYTIVNTEIYDVVFNVRKESNPCALCAKMRKGAFNEKAKELGVTPLATWVAGALAGVEPEVMGLGPIAATKKVMAKTGLSVADMDLIEANEAFAAQSVAVSQALNFDMNKVNVNGGAIALGHPVGASGARILVTLLYAMKHRGAHKGLATLCIGGGMGCATIVEMD